MPEFDPTTAKIDDPEFDPTTATPDEPVFDPSTARIDDDFGLASKLTLSDDYNPDDAAKALQQARATGLPPSLMMGSPDPDISRTQRLEERSKLIYQAPMLRNWIEQQPFHVMPVVQDDLQTLAQFDALKRTATNVAQVPGVAAARLAQGSFGLAAAVPGFVRGASESVLGITPKYWADAEEFLLDLAKGQAQLATEREGDREQAGNIEQGFYAGLESLAQNMPFLAASVVTGNPIPMIAGASMNVAGQEYMRAREQTDPLKAIAYATAQGGVEAVTEMIPAIGLIKDLKVGSGFMKTVLKQLAVEVPGEQIATAWQDFNEWAVLNPEQTLQDYLDARPDAAVQTLVATLTATGANVGIAKTVDAISGMSKDAREATDFGKLLAEYQRIAAASVVRDRDIETFDGFMQSITGDDGIAPEFLYIDGAKLIESGLAETLIQASPTVAEQAVLMQTGTMVRIPTSEVMGRFNQELAPLLPDLRQDPNGMTQREAEDYLKDNEPALRSLVESVTARSAENEEESAAREEIRATLADELVTFGGYQRNVADQYAMLVSTMYSTMAKRSGESARDLFNRRRLQIGAGPVEAGLTQVQSRLGMDFRDVTRRVPALTEAAQAVAEGRMSRDEYARLVDIYKPVQPYAEVPVPATQEQMYEALDSRKREKIDAPIEDGERVGLRLDIPAYTSAGVWVPTIHGATATSHRSVASITGVTFGEFDAKGLAYATGAKNKSPFAKIEGSFLNRSVEETVALAEAALNSPEWTQVGMDPERHGYFYDRNDHRSRIVSADEVIQVGPLVLAKNAVVKPLDDELYQRVFHGTPHRGITKFSTDKIGTGEGAQSYGWGLYFASRKEIAEYYRETLRFRAFEIAVEAEKRGIPLNARARGAIVRQSNANPDATDAQIARKVQNENLASRSIDPDMLAAFIGDYRKQGAGQLYEAEIPEDDEMLLWDEPLSEQFPKVRNALESAGLISNGKYGDGMGATPMFPSAMTFSGEKIYKRLIEKFFAEQPTVTLNARKQSEKAASQALAALGIKGIKYLDGGSRTAGDGTYNYVIFSGEDVEIVDEFYQASFTPRQARPIPPRIAAAADIGNAREIAASQQWQTNRDFKLAIQNAVRAVMGRRDLREDTPTNRAYITQQLLKEAREALVTNSNAIGWYDEKVTTALEVVSTIHPELKTDEQAKFAFIWALAVTSNGVKVDKNFELAERCYRIWKESDADSAKRRLPTTNIGVGPTASKIHEGLRAYNDLIQRWGFDRLRSFATTLQANRNVQATYGRKVSGEGMDTQVYGAGILGPKIGNGFFMNLYGEFGQLTMDRWWVRMWGRITGDLIEIDPAATRAARDSFVSLINLVKADRKALRAVEQAIGAKLNKGNPVETAKAIIKAASKEEVRDALDLILPATPEREAAAKEIRGKLKDFVSIGDELRKAAKSYYKYLDGQIEVPGGSRRRDMMREISQTVLAELQKDNPSLTMADFQALMWYPEKTLYDAAGAQEQDSEGYDDDEAPDYANAAIKLARDQGISNADITSAIERARSDIEARQRAGRSGRGSEGVSAAQGAGVGGNPPGTFAQGAINVRPERAGNRGGQYSSGSLAPLKGAPNVEGATGPDERLVAVAERYARENGIPLRRQGRYARVDRDRAARIAAAYEAMPHAPQDPAVKEAYENLIRQTIAQYRALEAAGYTFWFMDPENDPYEGNPRNAMRDLRQTQSMAVFPTVAGFGSGATELDVEDNPLLADTGIEWPYGSPEGEMKPVLANDLFRAVHDAFGHGLEGAGFRAQGEENAWQAHVRLFTGSAVGAITSETRGQNSWLNFGPYGETNRTAKVEDTVFADQKTGLMPEWTWTEGRVEDEPDQAQDQFEQKVRGSFSPRTLTIRLTEAKDLSTFLHESGHFFLHMLVDLAAQPNAPQDIVADAKTVLDWMGVKGTDQVSQFDTWLNMSVAEQTDGHERFARAFETYLLEGKAPSVELESVFRSFKRWLTKVYEQMIAAARRSDKSFNRMFVGQQQGKPVLNAEVRAVFDRLLATREEIENAQAMRSLGMMFKDEAEAAKFGIDWRAYQGLAANATEEAVDEMNARTIRDMRWMSNAKSRLLKKIQREANDTRKRVRQSVSEQAMKDPLYKAWQFLTADIDPEDPEAGGRLDEASVRRLISSAARGYDREAFAAGVGPDQFEATRQQARDGRVPTAGEMDADAQAGFVIARLKTYGMIAADGLDPEMVAAQFGFSSGDELIRKILNSMTPDEAIAAETDAQMERDYAELATEQGRAAMVDAALAGEMRARMVEAELSALERASKTREPTIVQAARRFARDLIGNLKVRDLRPGQFMGSSARAAKAAMTALGKGNLRVAAMEKRNQLINQYAGKYAQDAKDEIDAGLRYLRKFESKDIGKRVDVAQLDQIEKLLERFEFKKVPLQELDKRAALSDWIEQQREIGIEPELPDYIVAEAQRFNYRNMTVEQFRGLIDAVKQIEHLGRLKRKLLLARDKRTFEETVARINASIEANSRGPKRELRSRTTPDSAVLKGLRSFAAAHRKLSSIVYQIDGFKDGGPLWNALVRTANERGDWEAQRLSELTVRVAELLKNRNLQSRFSRGTYFPSIDMSLTWEERIGVALNWGNEGNRQRLLDGWNWDLFKITPVLESLTEDDWKLVQGIWDTFESMRPEIGAMEIRVMGKEPEWIEATPVRTRFGTFRGGYFPAAYDPEADRQADSFDDAEQAKRQLAASRAAATTRRNFVKSRAEKVNRPILLTMDAVWRNMTDVVHYLAWTEWLIDANRLIRHKDIGGAIRSAYGPEMDRQIIAAITDIAAGDAGKAWPGDAFFRHIRIGSVVAGLGLNLMNAMIQPLGLAQTIVRIGPKWAAIGVGAYTKGPIELYKAVLGKSLMMQNRMRTQNRELNDLRNKIRGKANWQQNIDQIMFLPMTAMQSVIDVPTWWGAYQKALAEMPVDMVEDEEIEAKAIAIADQAVLSAQGGGQVKDLAAIQRGPELAKLFTAFYGYFSTTYQLAVERTRATSFKSPGQIARLATDYLLLFVVPAVMTELIYSAFKGEEDDEEELANKLASAQVSYLFGMMVGVREASAAAQMLMGLETKGGGYGGPAGLRFFKELERFSQQAGQGEMDRALVRAGINVAGIALHLPSGQINRTIDGMIAIGEGRTQNPAVLVGGAPPQ